MGLGFRGSGVGFRVYFLGFVAEGSGYKVEGWMVAEDEAPEDDAEAHTADAS